MVEYITEVQKSACDTASRERLLEDCFAPRAKNSVPETRDLSKPFSLGAGVAGDFSEIMRAHPELNDRLFKLFTSSARGSVGEEQSAADNYSRAAFAQIATKYGADRLLQVLDAFHSLNPDLKPGYDRNSADLNINTPDGSPKDLNQRLYNVADLCKPGQLERFLAVGAALRNAGDRKTFSMKEFTPQLLTTLENPDQQRAYVSFNMDFQHGPDAIAQLAFLRLHPEQAYYHNPNVTPVETLRNFEAFRKTWTPGQ